MHYRYNEVHYKYTQMHWKYIQIVWCFFKYIYLALRIHSYVLIYILIPFKYTTIPSKNLIYFWHILQYHYYTPISFHIHPYTLKLSWNLSIPHLFVLSLHYFFKLSWRLIILPKCCTLAMTCLLESKNEAYSMNPINVIDSLNI
jgi:hypothetical protein